MQHVSPSRLTCLTLAIIGLVAHVMEYKAVLVPIRAWWGRREQIAARIT